jgi:hypothetical protein
LAQFPIFFGTDLTISFCWLKDKSMISKVSLEFIIISAKDASVIFSQEDK